MKIIIQRVNHSSVVVSGDTVGKITYMLEGAVLGTSDIFIAEDIEKISYFDVFLRIIMSIFQG